MKLRHVLVLFFTLVFLLAAAGAWLVVIQSPRSRVRTVVAELAPNLAPPARRHRVHQPPPPMAAEAAAPRQRAPKDRGPQTRHDPRQPKSGESVLVTVDLTGRANLPNPLLLEYQVVEPGRYIALADSAYERHWERLTMNDRGELGDATSGDKVFSAILPSDLQKHRRLIRYRIVSDPGAKPIAPVEGDPQPNCAYFVYDGVPPWKGAIHPKSGDPKLSQAVTFPSAALQRVPVYHFISSKRSVERAMWTEPAHFGQQDRHEYKYTGTLVYDGEVYDHVGFRARGGGWRHAMGKNMWKINFNPGHRFEPRDHYGQEYKAKWDKLNLGACIQQGDYEMRGEQGMFEAVGFRLFNLAGTEAPRTHWVHFRVITQEQESPPDQYSGDFWGLYLAVENIDEHFLKEHQLPRGNVYKMDFGPKLAFNGDPNAPNQEDISEFASLSMRRQQPADWWRKNVDLNRYYSYRSILEAIHHYDIDSGKNYFYYRNPQSGQWIVLPWDIDLSWGDNMFGAGFEPFYRAGLLSRQPFKHEYQQRLAELRDLLFNPEQVGLLIDEHAAMIWDPKGGPSLVDADRAKWDYHPILASRYVMESKAGQGKFYFGNPRNTFASMVKYMKTYASRRATWIDNRLLAGYRPPEAPTPASPDASAWNANGLELRLQKAGEGFTSYRWRLAEVTKPSSPSFKPNEPWKYEIQSVWEQEASSPAGVVIPGKLLQPGRTYRIRVRGLHANVTWSRWSNPVETTVPAGIGRAEAK